MKKFYFLPLIVFIVVFLTGNIGAQITRQDIRQKDNRKIIQQFEKARFQNQLSILNKFPTQNQEDFDILSYTLNLDLWPDTELLEGDVVLVGESQTNGLDHLEIDLFT